MLSLFFVCLLFCVFKEERAVAHIFSSGFVSLSPPQWSSGLDLSEATPSLKIQPLRVCVLLCVFIQTHMQKLSNRTFKPALFFFYLVSPPETNIHFKVFCFTVINLSQLSSLFIIFLFYCWNKAEMWTEIDSSHCSDDL